MRLGAGLLIINFHWIRALFHIYPLAPPHKKLSINQQPPPPGSTTTTSISQQPRSSPRLTAAQTTQPPTHSYHHSFIHPLSSTHLRPVRFTHGCRANCIPLVKSRCCRSPLFLLNNHPERITVPHRITTPLHPKQSTGEAG